MSKTLLSTLVLAVLLGRSGIGFSQDVKPLATVSFSGYDDLAAKLGIIGELSDNPDLAKGLDGAVAAATEGKGLAGLDKTKPWGAVVQAGAAGEFPIIGFLPVTDLDQLLGALSQVIGPAEDAGNGVKKIESPAGPGNPMYVKPQGNWAFISDAPGNLANVPADPVALLGGLEQKYVLAVLASVKNIPAEMRDEFKDNLEMGAQAIAQQMPGESQEDYEIRTGLTRRMIGEAIDVLNDLDEVVIGWAVDETSKSTYLDFQVTAVEGSKTADAFNQPVPGKTNFGGFDLPGAAVTGIVASSLSDTDVAELKKTVTNLRAKAGKELSNQGLSDDERQVAEKLLASLMDVVDATIDTKLIDGGMALMLEEGSLTLAAGGAIGEGDKLEAVLKQLVELAAQEEPAIKDLVKLDAETHAGVRFHTASLPTPDEDAKKIFGDTINVAVGINNTSLFVALGQDATGVLKQVIDGSAAAAGKQVPPFRLSISLTPIVEFAAKATEDPGAGMMIGMLGTMLQQAQGKDHVTVTSTQVTNGGRVRVELEEGILKLIGAAAQMAGSMGGGGGFPGPPPAGDSF